MAEAVSTLPSPQSADAADVIAAIRLGWTLAEFKGRHRPDPPPIPRPRIDLDKHRPLPLRSERPPEDQAVEAQRVLVTLADRLDVDALAQQRGTRTEHHHFTSRLTRLTQDLDRQRARGDGKQQETWQRFSDAVYDWDAHIQDELTARSEPQECGYELGRGLAEMFWALNPKSRAPHDPTSWTFLIGRSRVHELTHLVGRLAGYLHPLAAPAIIGSLEQWQHIAANPRLNPEHTREALRQQLRHWYGLLVLGQSPMTFLQRTNVRARWQATRRGLQLFGGELVLGALALVLAGIVVTLILTGTADDVARASLGLLAIIGVSASVAAARVKTATQSLIDRARTQTDVDLLVEAITVEPAEVGAAPVR
jgi:hypothetical protein